MKTTSDFGPFAFLKLLNETPGIPGREERVRDLILAQTEGLWDETRVDSMGNLICLKRATRVAKKGKAAAERPLRVMVACHMDEIGFYVRHVDENGFVRIHNVGGFDTRNLFARRVIVHGKQDLLGILNPAGKPVHIATDEERKKIPEIVDFCVDLCRPKGEVLKLVEIGDPVTLVQSTELIGDAVCGKAMDNRIALWVGINAIRQACGLDYLTPAEPGTPAAAPRAARRGKAAPTAGLAYDVYFVACVQEEVGLRGATAAAYGIDPDIGLVIDTTLCCDTPGVGKDLAITEFGKGAAIKVMDGAAISHRGLFDEFVALATKKRIPFQREILPRGGTDAGAVQKTRAGVRTITISVPTRYIHTITEAVHRKDAQAAVALIAAWLGG